MIEAKDIEEFKTFVMNLDHEHFLPRLPVDGVGLDGYFAQEDHAGFNEEDFQKIKKWMDEFQGENELVAQNENSTEEREAELA